MWLKKIATVIFAYIKRLFDNSKKITINGITFYCANSLTVTEDIKNQLNIFSENADEDSYTVYLDSENLVIY